MTATVEHADILSAFGFAVDAPPSSIYRWAPVYRVERGGRSFVVKRTREGGMPGAMAAWTASLAAAGARVVSPAAGFSPNPRSFPSRPTGAMEIWVVYPFIEGVPYRGDSIQFMAAGALLGKIHALGAEGSPGLRAQPRVVAVAAADLDESAAALDRHLAAHAPALVARAARLLADRRARYPAAVARLGALSLPLADCSWDYKVSNLVFETDRAPWLIDPDNGARIPRLYDLAIAALLLHNDPEQHRGPRRPPTPAEWVVFLAGYARHVRLTAAERAAWDDALLSAWMDESLWLLGDHAEGWADPDSRRWLSALLALDLSALRPG